MGRALDLGLGPGTATVLLCDLGQQSPNLGLSFLICLHEGLHQMLSQTSPFQL